MSRFRRRLMGLSALRQAAADDFVRVEYLENISNAYIQTNIIPNAGTGLKTKAYFTDSRDVYFVGLRNDGGNTRWGIGHGGAGFYYCYGNYQGTNRLVDTKGEFYLNYKNDKKFITIDLDDSSTLTSNLPNLSFTPKFGIRIFGAAGSGANTIVKSRIYYLQITQGSEIIRDFIPMYQISTDTYGLWDRVTEEFYTSPNGVKFTGGERYDTTDIIEVHPKLIANTYINENSGAQQNYGGWSSSDYIDVEGFKYIQVPYPFSKSNYKYGAYYDKDKRRISNTSSFVIPSNAKYVRLSTVTSTFTNVWLFKRQLTTTDIYRANSYIETDGSIRAYNGWNIFNTESVYNYFYCWIYSQSYRYQASYNADDTVYQSGKGFLERPEGGKVLLSDSNTSITYYAGYNYEYKNMNE